MTPEQSRAARGWLNWSQGELAVRAGVAKNTVYLFEAGKRTPTADSLAALRRAIEAAGVRLVFDRLNGSAVGILLRDAEPDLADDTSA
jgi:transcriptional regulator with XRE-family HTH domain